MQQGSMALGSGFSAAAGARTSGGTSEAYNPQVFVPPHTQVFAPSHTQVFAPSHAQAFSEPGFTKQELIEQTISERGILQQGYTDGSAILDASLGNYLVSGEPAPLSWQGHATRTLGSAGVEPAPVWMKGEPVEAQAWATRCGTVATNTFARLGAVDAPGREQNREEERDKLSDMTAVDQEGADYGGVSHEGLGHKGVHTPWQGHEQYSARPERSVTGAVPTARSPLDEIASALGMRDAEPGLLEAILPSEATSVGWQEGDQLGVRFLPKSAPTAGSSVPCPSTPSLHVAGTSACDEQGIACVAHVCGDGYGFDFLAAGGRTGRNGRQVSLADYVNMREQLVEQVVALQTEVAEKNQLIFLERQKRATALTDAYRKYRCQKDRTTQDIEALRMKLEGAERERSGILTELERARQLCAFAHQRITKLTSSLAVHEKRTGQLESENAELRQEIVQLEMTYESAISVKTTGNGLLQNARKTGFQGTADDGCFCSNILDITGDIATDRILSLIRRITSKTTTDMGCQTEPGVRQARFTQTDDATGPSGDMAIGDMGNGRVADRQGGDPVGRRDGVSEGESVRRTSPAERPSPTFRAPRPRPIRRSSERNLHYDNREIVIPDIAFHLQLTDPPSVVVPSPVAAPSRRSAPPSNRLSSSLLPSPGDLEEGEVVEVPSRTTQTTGSVTSPEVESLVSQAKKKGDRKRVSAKDPASLVSTTKTTAPKRKKPRKATPSTATPTSGLSGTTSPSLPHHLDTDLLVEEIQAALQQQPASQVSVPDRA